MSYSDGLYLAGRADFNCADHTIISFQPVDDRFEAGMDYVAYFRYFDCGKLPGYFRQGKAWKYHGRPISMAPSEGHDLLFEGQRVYSYKFLLKHWPVRSQGHGEKKVFHERKVRWNPLERGAGTGSLIVSVKVTSFCASCGSNGFSMKTISRPKPKAVNSE